MSCPRFASITPRRFAYLLGLVAFTFTLFVLRSAIRHTAWREIPQVFGLGDLLPDSSDLSIPGDDRLPGWNAEPVFVGGQTKPPGSNYTRYLVMARTTKEDVSWVDEQNLDIVKKIYVADDPSAPLHPPQNKGHEAMIYLTYIIDHYEELPDVSIFMHAHRWSWHNNDLLNNDAAEMIRRLSSERVVREGYMSLRCQWFPGCPDWMHPGAINEDSEKHEETLMAMCWSELFPGQPIPRVLAGACCAQFALSRERIRAIPVAKYRYYRDWLFRTSLRDSMSGRIWEYLWHVVFTGESVACPDQHACYCDGYGVCFDGPAAYQKWVDIRLEKKAFQKELDGLNDGKKKVTLASGEDVAARKAYLRTQIRRYEKDLDERRNAAVERGRDPRVRAQIAGRPWKEGDGF